MKNYEQNCSDVVQNRVLGLMQEPSSEILTMRERVPENCAWDGFVGVRGAQSRRQNVWMPFLGQNGGPGARKVMVQAEISFPRRWQR